MICYVTNCLQHLRLMRSKYYKIRDQPFVNEGIFAEFGIQHARKMMVLALLAVHALEKHGENVSPTFGTCFCNV